MCNLPPKNMLFSLLPDGCFPVFDPHDHFTRLDASGFFQVVVTSPNRRFTQSAG
jgi:hypothetical protein